MARVTRVDKSRKEHTCGRGGHVIPIGDPYLWAKPGFRGTPRYRCLCHPFRRSELTVTLAAEPLAAVEAFEDIAGSGRVDSIEHLQDEWDALVAAVEDYASQREESLAQWEHGNPQLEELFDIATAAVDNVAGHSIEEFEEPEPARSDYPEGDEGEREYEVARDEWGERRAEHVAEQAEQALEVALSLEF